MTGAVTVRQLTVEYVSGGYPVRPLDALDLDVADGDLALLLGPSGCGKTTLLSCLAGILQPTSGSVCVGDVDVVELDAAGIGRFRQQTVGVVFQAFNLLPSLTARDNVAVPMRLAGRSRTAALACADELLGSVGMEERLHHRPAQLSGGQQQRAAIARALALDPPVLLADEPTAHLDHVQVESVLRLLRRLARPGRAVVVSTHDHRMVPLADRCLDLAPKAAKITEPGRTVELAAGEVLFRQGDPSDLVYEVQAGEIELYRELADGGGERLRLSRAGEYFGELGPILSLPRSASARAIGAARVRGSDVTSFRARRPEALSGAASRDGSTPGAPTETA